MKTKIKYLLVLVLASFVFAGCASMHESKAWEYKIVFLKNGEANAQLNELGKDGWKLVSDTSGGNNEELNRYIFERPKH